MEENTRNCTLTDEELINACQEWIYKLAESGGSAWCLSVPVRFNRDPDMLFFELIKRFQDIKSPLASESGPVSSGLPCSLSEDNSRVELKKITWYPK